MTRRDRSIRHALDKLTIMERYAREAREALMEAEREEPPKVARVSEADVHEARTLMRLEA